MEIGTCEIVVLARLRLRACSTSASSRTAGGCSTASTCSTGRATRCAGSSRRSRGHAATRRSARRARSGARRGVRPRPRDAEASAEIFATYADGVVQVEIQESGSAAKRSIGSGFAVEPRGLLRHQLPRRGGGAARPRAATSVKIRTQDGAEHDATLVAFDVVQDLALLRSADAPRHAVPLARRRRAAQGRAPLLARQSARPRHERGRGHLQRPARALALRAHPLQRLAQSRHERRSGAAVLRRGRGRERRHRRRPGVVPGARARGGGAARARAPGSASSRPRTCAPSSRPSSCASSRATWPRSSRSRFGEVRMGPYVAPTGLAPFFNCWGDAPEDEKAFYQERSHSCFTEDHVFVSDEQSFAIVELHHRQVESRPALGSPLLLALLVALRGGLQQALGPRGRLHALPLRHGLRREREPDLQGHLLRAPLPAPARASTTWSSRPPRWGRPADGFETALLLSGVALEPARELSRRVLESIRWAE